jgi:hypothetical protein
VEQKRAESEHMRDAGERRMLKEEGEGSLVAQSKAVHPPPFDCLPNS